MNNYTNQNLASSITLWSAILIPIVFIICLSILLITLLVFNEPKKKNVIRIYAYAIIQFIAMPLLVLFILVNLILFIISITCKKSKKKLMHVSGKSFWDCIFRTFEENEAVIEPEKIQIGKKKEIKEDKENEIDKDKDKKKEDGKEVKNNKENNEKLSKERTSEMKVTIQETDKVIKIETTVNAKKDENFTFKKDSKENCSINQNGEISYNKELPERAYKYITIDGDSNNDIENEKRKGVFTTTHTAIDIPITLIMKDESDKIEVKQERNKYFDFLKNMFCKDDNTPGYVNFFKGIKDKYKKKLEEKDHDRV